MSKSDYEYLLDHLNQDLPVMSLNFTEAGELWSFAVYAMDTCITIFVDGNYPEYEVNYNGNSNY